MKKRNSKMKGFLEIVSKGRNVLDFFQNEGMYWKVFQKKGMYSRLFQNEGMYWIVSRIKKCIRIFQNKEMYYNFFQNEET